MTESSLKQRKKKPFSLSDLNLSLPTDLSSLPFVTILIPTFNCSQTLPLTLDSIINQNYPHYEILVIDAGSTDRTLEVLHGYGSRIHLHSAPAYDIYPILNQGIPLAKGDYLNILFPGDFYIHPKTLWQMMSLALQKSLPDLIYCATLLRDDRAAVKFLFRPLSLSLLKRGQQPTSLQACWFKKNLFETLGLFRTDFQMRGGFDFFCRFCLHSNLRFATLRRAFIDFDLRGVTSTMVIRHFRETGKIIFIYFGKWAWMRWFLRQNEVKRFVRLWARRLKMAFIERK
jgi:glycosyltransferase involved in cell wall biosynthesis